MQSTKMQLKLKIIIKRKIILYRNKQKSSKFIITKRLR